ncbi:hypothetical protein AVEN_176568-1 [Araneus ventricosus]|uniref:Uncharacterized protein n=1 Tax=Araneus ventricosus TaxID=182803 RepID=A0A4Y2TDB7_ARAVE|nr:hypothetical protein AVEN_176568-1 [Araneus ventricosus]
MTSYAGASWTELTFSLKQEANLKERLKGRSHTLIIHEGQQTSLPTFLVYREFHLPEFTHRQYYESATNIVTFRVVEWRKLQGHSRFA